MLVPMGEEAAEGGAFEAAVSVMRAYAEQDAEFAEALQLVVREEARLGRPLKREEWPAALQRMLVVPELGVERMAAERMVATVARELTDQWERMVGVEKIAAAAGEVMSRCEAEAEAHVTFVGARLATKDPQCGGALSLAPRGARAVAHWQRLRRKEEAEQQFGRERQHALRS